MHLLLTNKTKSEKVGSVLALVNAFGACFE